MLNLRLLVAAVFMLATGVATANILANCANSSGTCVAALCARDEVHASQLCSDKCPGGKVSSYSSPSPCLTPDQIAAKPPAEPSPIKESDVSWCVEPTGGYDPSTDPATIKSALSHPVYDQNITQCMQLELTDKFSQVYCRVNDGYGVAWCKDQENAGSCGSGYWAWVTKAGPRLTKKGDKIEMCIQFYNQSKNRWRQFQFYVK